MSQDDHYINGELLRLGREARGWLIGDMAIRACMSVKQIRQLEEGGTSAFYSPAVKMTSAKKLAGILDIAPEQVFQRPGSAALETVTPVATETTVTPADDQPAVAEDITPPQPAVVHSTPEPQDATPSAAAVEPKAKTSVWTIVALFVAALGVAAYMHQQEEPATEPPPPLQVIPTEAEPTASAASAADTEASNASAASDRVAVPAASAPVAPASAVPAASAPATPKPAASAASKPL